MINIFVIYFQDVVYALAHATGKTGRFTLIERWRNNERLLAPQEHPLKVSQTYTVFLLIKAAAFISKKKFSVWPLLECGLY